MKERVRTCTNPSRSSAPSPLAQALTGTPSNKPASYYSALATKFSNPSLYPLPYGGNRENSHTISCFIPSEWGWQAAQSLTR